MNVMESYSEKQKLALELMRNLSSLFITSEAGCGKTFVLKKFILEYKDKNRLKVTSTTAISSLLINGSTLHSALGIGLGLDPEHEIIETMTSYNKKVWRSLKTLIIDEVSMLTAELFDKLNNISKSVRHNNLPFGGIQVILSGDLLQLPCINEERMVFEAQCWNEVIPNIIYLDKNFRQSNCNSESDVFSKVLSKIRVGIVDDEVQSLLKSRMDLDVSEFIPKIMCLKRKVEEVNSTQIALFKSKKVSFKCYNAKIDFSNNFEKNKFLKNWNTPQKISICVGMKVILTYNINPSKKLVNGIVGFVSGFSERNYPIVKFSNISTEIEPITWTVKKYGSVKQIPLKIGYGVTIHSFQGSELEEGEVDFENAFEYGQVYSALSRFKFLKGLFIKNLDFKRIIAHPKALDFYNNLKL